MSDKSFDGFQAGYKRFPLGTSIKVTSFEDNYGYSLGGQDTAEHWDLLEKQQQMTVFIQRCKAKIRL